jgi:hypothetical protein
VFNPRRFDGVGNSKPDSRKENAHDVRAQNMTRIIIINIIIT